MQLSMNKINIVHCLFVMNGCVAAKRGLPSVTHRLEQGASGLIPDEFVSPLQEGVGPLSAFRFQGNEIALEQLDLVPSGQCLHPSAVDALNHNRGQFMPMHSKTPVSQSAARAFVCVGSQWTDSRSSERIWFFSNKGARLTSRADIAHVIHSARKRLWGALSAPDSSEDRPRHLRRAGRPVRRR
jgi:hypothetical protein